MSYTADTPAPGTWTLVMGVVFPLLAIGIELVTGWCAGAFFDPLPSVWHLALVLLVPGVNLALWRAARDEAAPPRRLAVLGGAAIAVAATYTLLFLPILPLALVGIILFGLGLLPFSPLLATIASVRLLNALGDRWRDMSRTVAAGVALGLGALIAVDLPATATHLALRYAQGDRVSEARGVALMRTLGDREMLLRLCFGDDGRATGLVSVFASMWQGGLFADRVGTSSGEARRLYYRVTGAAFNAVPQPGGLRGRGRDEIFDFDADRGGTAVGGQAEGLSLVRSRIDGSVSAADNLAYAEWTAEFANASGNQQEARMTLALPEGAVASRATLWVNGNPREASVAGRGAARAAYESVVRTRRDPLLVTTDGAGRLLVQAFPVQPGATLKLRIGFSAPLAIASNGTRTLALPAIVDRNFAIGDDVRHAVWVESGTGLGEATDGLSVSRLPGGGTRVRGELTDAVLLGSRPRIAAPRIVAASSRIASLGGSGQTPLRVVQTIARGPATRPAALTILLDASTGNAGAASALSGALGAIPSGLPVGLVIAADTPVIVPPAPWSPAQRDALIGAIERTDFVGGQDDVGMLADAIAMTPGGALLWVHGPQPVEFSASGAALEQRLERDTVLPRLIRYQATPGPAYVADDSGWFDAARVVVPTGDATRDLTRLLRDIGGVDPRWNVTRAEGGAAAAATGSPHIVRLWAAERIARAPDARGGGREAATRLASRLGLITPVSGAVVLETDAEYGRAGLDVPGAAEVPTVPEPGTWALIAVLCALGGWLLLRRRRAAAFA